MPPIVLLVGGPGSEHDISIKSGVNVCDALLQAGYEVHTLVGTKDNKWMLTSHDMVGQKPSLHEGEPLASVLLRAKEKLTDCVVFPVLHGPFGEGGIVQGLCESMELPYVGCDHTASVLCMNKVWTKTMLASVGIPVCPGMVRYTSMPKPSREECVSQYFSPLFVKPARNGSSVGVNKCRTSDEFTNALDEAMKWDTTVLIEKNAGGGLEVEFAVLEEDGIITISGPGAISSDDFYSYDEKYSTQSTTKILVPAPISDDQKKIMTDYTRRAFMVCGCRGLARVDFFLCPDGTIYLNEINTMPGFTAISLYPKLMEYDGIDKIALVHRLIQSAKTVAKK